MEDQLKAATDEFQSLGGVDVLTELTEQYWELNGQLDKHRKGLIKLGDDEVEAIQAEIDRIQAAI